MNYSSRDVLEICPSLTLRKLQYWDECGIVSPSLEGHRRLYTESELFKLRIICELCRKKVTLSKIRAVLKNLRKFGCLLHGRRSRYMVVDPAKGRVQMGNDAAEVCEILAAAGNPMVVIRMPDAPAPRAEFAADAVVMEATC